ADAGARRSGPQSAVPLRAEQIPEQALEVALTAAAPPRDADGANRRQSPKRRLLRAGQGDRLLHLRCESRGVRGRLTALPASSPCTRRTGRAPRSQPARLAAPSAC